MWNLVANGWFDRSRVDRILGLSSIALTPRFPWPQNSPSTLLNRRRNGRRWQPTGGIPKHVTAAAACFEQHIRRSQHAAANGGLALLFCCPMWPAIGITLKAFLGVGRLGRLNSGAHALAWTPPTNSDLNKSSLVREHGDKIDADEQSESGSDLFQKILQGFAKGDR